MTESVFKKIVAEYASEVCADIELDAPALALLGDQTSPGVYLQTLMDANHVVDAIRFLARAMPKREATWWACLCVRDAFCPEAPERMIKAVESAERWVYEPTEENRRAAHAAAEAADFEGAASWSAMAAFWSGESMAPPNAPAVPPADNLTAKAASGAIQLAAVLSEPERAQEKYQLFLKRGIDIASGGNGRIESGRA